MKKNEINKHTLGLPHFLTCESRVAINKFS